MPGLADTALALAIDPSLVRRDKRRGRRGGGQPANGVAGDPRRAERLSSDKQGVDAIVTRPPSMRSVARR